MRKSIVAAAAVLAMAGLVWAAGRPGVVKTRDGTTYDGSVDEHEQEVVVNVRGIETSIPRDNVQSISYGDFDTRWNDAYQKLDKKDEAGRIAAAHKAFDEHRYDLAEKALRDVMAINPNNAEAADMLKLTMSQRRMEHASGNSAGQQPTNDAPAGSSGAKPAGQWTELSTAEINAIKMAEVRADDSKARFAFENGVQKKYYDNHPELAGTYRNLSEFMRAPQATRATMIYKDGGDFAKDVHMTNDPEMIVNFRKTALPLVLQGCATSLCHGGSDPTAISKFALISPAPDAAAVYTDYFVLTSAKVNQNSGIADNVMNGGPTWAYLFDRTHPDSSLALQYGLPDAAADFKHPKVGGYQGIYPRGKSDPKYAAVLEFIKSLPPVQPDYGISFKLERTGQSMLPTSLPST